MRNWNDAKLGNKFKGTEAKLNIARYAYERSMEVWAERQKLLDHS